LLTSACTDATAPEENCPTASAPLCALDAQALTSMRLDLDDAGARIAAHLEDPVTRQELARWIPNLSSNLGRGAVTFATGDLREAQAAVSRAMQRTSFPGDRADLAALELELDFIAAQLDG
jgi:hypothetical protein